MNKHIVIALVGAILIPSCTKVNIIGRQGAAVAFQTASYASRAGIEGSEFPADDAFAVVAWAEGTIDGGFFMDHERISYYPDSRLWMSGQPIYWPQDVPVDFFGYYPYGMKDAMDITATTVAYNGIDVEAGQQDVMYSSKAVGYGYNPDGKGPGIDGSAGVPILFHHALSKVQVEAYPAFTHREEADGTVYDWSITVNSCTISSFYRKGGAQFTLAAEPAEGMVEYVKPVDAEGFCVWTNDGTTASHSSNVPVELVGEEPLVILPQFFTLPQAIGKEFQRISVDITIKTRRNGEDFLSENMSRSAFIWLEDVPAWEINHYIIYRLVIGPIGTGPAGQPAVVSFDPAVADWDVITVSTPIAI